MNFNTKRASYTFEFGKVFHLLIGKNKTFKKKKERDSLGQEKEVLGNLGSALPSDSYTVLILLSGGSWLSKCMGYSWGIISFIKLGLASSVLMSLHGTANQLLRRKPKASMTC